VAAWFVPLAPVTDPAEVPSAVPDAFGAREPVIARRSAGPGRDPLERLAAALAERDDVLILDNCEHVIEAAALAGHILATCPRMRPDFELDEASAAAVARICRSLDGMPLAIELAAVWLRTLTPAQLAERLDDRFALLTGGSRIAMPRHRTLRAVMDWSWGLLSAAEQRLARRLAVFPGGATLASAERVCADERLPSAAVLPALSGLIDKSLLGAADGPDGSRYQMLETVRAYGLERMAEAGEETAVRDAFTAHYLALAAARGTITVAAGDGLRDLLAELVHAAGLVRRIGVNLNQAVARLHATGRASGDLARYADESLRRGERLDAVAECVRDALR
jgi:predicted ATPase